MFSWVKFTAGRWVWSGSGELLGGLVKAIHHSVHGRHGLYHVVEGLVPEKSKIQTKHGDKAACNRKML